VAAALCNQFNPARIVVGGVLARAGDLLLDPLRQTVRRHAIPSAADDVEIVAGQLGDRAELLGALALAVGQSDRALSGRLRAATGR
jgi:predicted NBD/HSP70 family sugar kinase